MLKFNFQFCLAVSHPGLEKNLKRDISFHYPNWKMGFSAGPIVTFKFDQINELDKSLGISKFSFKSLYAKQFSFCIEQINLKQKNLSEYKNILTQWLDQVDDFHVINHFADSRKFKENSLEVMWLEKLDGESLQFQTQTQTQKQKQDQKKIPLKILELHLVSENLAWLTLRFFDPQHSFWPWRFKGTLEKNQNREVISRAHYKLEEFLLGSQLKICEGQKVIELGSAPGGMTELILNFKAFVIGVDASKMDPSITTNPHFHHAQIPAQNLSEICEQVKKIFKNKSIDWIINDMNLDPVDSFKYLMNLVKIYRPTNIIFTLKLPRGNELERNQFKIHYEKKLRELGYTQIWGGSLSSCRREVMFGASASTTTVTTSTK